MLRNRIHRLLDGQHDKSAQKFCGYIGLCPTTSSSGGKTHQGKLMRTCDKWPRWAFAEAAWVAIGCSPYFGDIYKKKRAHAKKANTAILCVARRMIRITATNKSKASPPAVGEPVELKFNAVKGGKVNISTLKGKVVLIDFWATWCGPCVAEVPNVVAAYKKLHDKGFEIIGISLDQDKSALTKFTKDKEMTWMQYFDGKGWDNEIATRFGIQSVPAMWLVDKEGKLVSTNARDNLEAQVEALLAK